jgi:hypothetical protein
MHHTVRGFVLLVSRHGAGWSRLGCPHGRLWRVLVGRA